MSRVLGRLLVLLAVVPVSIGATWAPFAEHLHQPQSLTFEDRVAAQRAIEEVYWRHRIWPKENPSPKPSLDAMMPESAIRTKVEDYLKKSNALEKWWQRPITGAQLQAELGRMARDTHDPRVLRELFDALRGDALVLAETLARQVLADRLARSWYASDERFHGEARRRADAAFAACRDAQCLKAMGGVYSETTWKLEDGETGDLRAAADNAPSSFDARTWSLRLERLAAAFDARPDSLPIRTWSRPKETTGAFVMNAVLSQREGEIVMATTAWPRRSFDDWWKAERVAIGTAVRTAEDRFTLPRVDLVACAGDTWTPTYHDAPDPRSEHSAVWTGTEMIVWGGSLSNGATDVNSGGRYDPATDTWTATSMGAGVPDPRRAHTAVWTGTEMIVWGGHYFNRAVLVSLNTGGRYDPSADAWSPTSTGANVPSARSGHTAVWTGEAMIVWGGGSSGSGNPNTGGRYDPRTNTWSSTSTGANAPSARGSHTAVWTGTEMIVWGGGSSLNTGGRYNPVTDTWTATSTGENLPLGRILHSAVWTGKEMIVWGGYDGTASRNDGARYDPAQDRWSPTSTGADAAQAMQGHTAVWTGSEMIVWGLGANLADTGRRYDPVTDAWTPVSRGTVPALRESHSAVWTGAEMIVWGGFDFVGAPFNTGGRYDPVTDNWTATSTGENVPAARVLPGLVWTGREMIVWPSESGSTSGSRYDPVTDRWTTTAAWAGAPTGRRSFALIWTGREMIVWGGYTYDGSNHYLNSGGRYDPAVDRWTATSMGASVPSPRAAPAVWTGTEMVVWGGTSGMYLNTGGRYDPTLDRWTATSVGANVPSPRSAPVVWTGREMIVWGGYGNSYLNSGGRYDPATDTWTATSMGAGVPDPRRAHTAVWTGTEMIVWGGYGNQGTLNMERGGRYDPGTNTWTATSTAGIPPLRVFHSSVWTGMDMIVWGGEPPTSVGGRYCACPEGRIAYRDADGDGYGAAGVSIPSCDGSIPAGYVDDSTDCNDANAAVHRGAVEVCNGVDDNCNGLVDEDTNGEDSDGDLIHNLCDNWPFNYNPTQSDTDHDGQGDVCDLDDGLIWEWRNDRASVSWQAEQGPKAWDVYIGDLDVLKKTGVYTQAPGSNALADRHCGEAQTFADDLGVPAAGKVSFSLVTGVTNGVEGSLGSSSSGARPNANPCP